jgi:hypothetical protein
LVEIKINPICEFYEEKTPTYTNKSHLHGKINSNILLCLKHKGILKIIYYGNILCPLISTGVSFNLSFAENNPYVK